ncbi:MAG: ribbon-helix-helix domain-containing protein [Acidobacteriota bacterium]|nr:ribbon-helix-helix domain-containing protein [Acidobacteriota bacterium]
MHKIAIALDERCLRDIDRLVKEGRYPNRSKAVQSALALLTERDRRVRLQRELNKLHPAAERRLAEEGLGDFSWPSY